MELGADPDLQDNSEMTPLHFAKEIEIVKLLVEAGANINQEEKVFGHTPFYHAIKSATQETVKYLLEIGAVLSAKDLKWGYPIHHAVRHQRLDVVKLLIENKVDLQVRAYYGGTPYMLALEERSKYNKKIAMLIEEALGMETNPDSGYYSIVYKHRSKEVKSTGPADAASLKQIFLDYADAFYKALAAEKVLNPAITLEQYRGLIAEAVERMIVGVAKNHKLFQQEMMLLPLCIAHQLQDYLNTTSWDYEFSIGSGVEDFVEMFAHSPFKCEWLYNKQNRKLTIFR